MGYSKQRTVFKNTDFSVSSAAAKISITTGIKKYFFIVRCIPLLAITFVVSCHSATIVSGLMQGALKKGETCVF